MFARFNTWKYDSIHGLRLSYIHRRLCSVVSGVLFGTENMKTCSHHPGEGGSEEGRDKAVDRDKIGCACRIEKLCSQRSKGTKENGKRRKTYLLIPWSLKLYGMRVEQGEPKGTKMRIEMRI